MYRLNRFTLTITFCLLALGFQACREETIVPSVLPVSYRYFPLDTGTWVIYDVDSIVHLDRDDAFGVDTSVEIYRFQLMETIDSSFIDGEQEQAFRISRFRRANDSLPWEFQTVWSAKRNSMSAQRVEDNVRFVRMSFPIDSRSTWNGNAYNYYPEEMYYYEDIHQPFSVQSLSFDSTVRVIQSDFVSNVNRITKNERYASGVGLVEKQLDSLRTTLAFGPVLILNGIEYSQRINSYHR